jgi:hypothetical protein
VVVPSFRSFSAGTGDDEQGYRRRVTDRELWSGMGYGRKLGERFRLGVSAFYILRSVTDLESVAVLRDPGTGEGVAFDSVVNDVSLVNGNAVLIAGAKLRLDDDWSVGLSLQSPSLYLHSQATLQYTRMRADPSVASGPKSDVVTKNLDSLESHTRHAPVLRAGVSYSPRYRYTLSADISLHAPVSYALVVVKDRETRGLLPFNPRVERRAVLNANAGVEYLVIREVSVAVGVFSDFSSAPRIPTQPVEDYAPRTHLLGMTMALGYFGKHSLSRLGFVYSFGGGDDVIPRSNIERVLEQEQAFQRVSYSQSFFYVFLSSSFRY